MPKYKVTVVKHWDEHGEIVIDADDEDAARDDVREMLSDGGEQIEWGPMDPQGEEVESVGVARDDASKRKRKSANVTPDAAVIERAAPCSPFPCPFCGKVPQYLATGSVSHPDEIIVHRFLCISGSCGVQPFSGWHLSAEEAAAVWNTRSPANDPSSAHG